MNALKYFVAASFLLAIVSCTKTNFGETSFVNSATAPNKLAALFNITQDNTGNVTITPNGEGASYYAIYYGDGNVDSVTVLPGKNTQHKYAEGVYNVKIVAHNITGKTAEVSQSLTVSFKAPENLNVTAAVDAANNYKVNVSAKANFETLFKVYFGDVANEVPISFLEGETISHTYAAVGTYTLKVVALSGGAAVTEFTKTITIVDPVLLPVTFESPTVVYAFNNFDGGNASVINNPQINGLNTSAKVGKMVKSPGQPWGGTVLTLGQPIDFSTNKVFRMKVFSPRIGAKVLLKVENAANTALNFEKEVATTVANSWEDLAFDYNAVVNTNTYEHIVLIFDNGTQGDGSANFTFLFDDIRQTNSMPNTQINLPVTFDDPKLNYAVTDFGNNVSVDAVDPTNQANKVKKTIKPNGAQTWAGTTIGTPLGFASAIPVTATATKMSMRIYSPAAGLTIKLKIENHVDGAKSVESDAVTTVANTWETLVFDFANNSAGTPAINFSTVYDKASVFFDFNVAGSGKVFYWDDVAFGTGAAVDVLALPLSFESTTLTYAFTDFNGGNVTIINNPQSTGINTSAKVGKMVKNAGEVYGGSYLTLPNPIDFSTKKIFKMKVYSPRVGAKVLLKVENLNSGAIGYEQSTVTTLANQWEELTFDYSAIDATKSYQKIVLIFELGTVGDGSANFTFLFDDISLN